MPFLFLPEVLAARAAALNPPHAGAEVCYRFAFHRQSVRYALFHSNTKAAESFYDAHIRRFCRDNEVPRPSKVILRTMDQSVQEVHCTWRGCQGPDGDHWVGLMKTGMDLADLRPCILLQRYKLVAVELVDLKLTARGPELSKATSCKRPASSVAERARLAKRQRGEDATPKVTFDPPAREPGSPLPVVEALCVPVSVAPDVPEATPNYSIHDQVRHPTVDENTPEDSPASEAPAVSTPVANSTICSAVKSSSGDPLGKKVLGDLSNVDSLSNDHKRAASSDPDSKTSETPKADRTTRPRSGSGKQSMPSLSVPSSLSVDQPALVATTDQHQE